MLYLVHKRWPLGACIILISPAYLWRLVGDPGLQGLVLLMARIMYVAGQCPIALVAV